MVYRFLVFQGEKNRKNKIRVCIIKNQDDTEMKTENRLMFITFVKEVGMQYKFKLAISLFYCLFINQSHLCWGQQSGYGLVVSSLVA